MTYKNETVEIASSVYWVGSNNQELGLHCNPYLIVDGEEAILIDPGSILDFEQVYENVLSIVPLEAIKYVILQHQDPDFCSSVPLFEKKGGQFKIVTHWRTQSIVQFYGIKSQYYLVNENNFELTLNSGRKLAFITTPYLHFPGAIVTYDPTNKILFSSDIFGAFSYKWQLYAGDDYIEAMKEFHEHYMPSNDILRPVMEIFQYMDIEMIASQHGSIINKDIKMYINVLKHLDCGKFLLSTKKKALKTIGYHGICNQVIHRLISIFDLELVLEVVGKLDVEFNNETNEIVDYSCSGQVLWNKLFEVIYLKKGLSWLIILEPMISKISSEYDVKMPAIYESTLLKAYNESSIISEENRKLKEINESLVENVRETQDRMFKCPITKIYNEEFFKSYMVTEITSAKESTEDSFGCLFVISIDNMSKIRFSYGNNEVDEVLIGVVYILNELRADNHLIFRLQGASFAYYIRGGDKKKSAQMAEKIRNVIYESNRFIEKITVSIGVASIDEVIKPARNAEQLSFDIYDMTMSRVKKANNAGGNIVVIESSEEEEKSGSSTVLLVGDDQTNIDVVKTFLIDSDYEVIIANDGEMAVEIIEKGNIDVIVSEIMMPKMDGFLLKERISYNSNTKKNTFYYFITSKK